MNSRIGAALALAAVAFVPLACGTQPEEQQHEQQTLTGDPDAPEGIAVTNGRLLLAPVSGNPAAVYFDIANSGPEQVVIRAAHVEGAETAEIHETSTIDGRATMHDIDEQPVAAGETVRFVPGGLHVMAMEPADTLTPGSETLVTLTFESGDKVSFPADVRAAGDER